MKLSNRKIAKGNAETLRILAARVEEIQMHLVFTMRAGFGLDRAVKKMREAAEKLEMRNES